jgi:hypothetical protein
VSALTPAELHYFTDVDFCDHVALVMTVNEHYSERIIAVGRLIRLDPPRNDEAEVASTVAEEYQHLGAATLLLRHLARLACGLDMRKFVAIVQEDNRDMLQVFKDSPYPTDQKLEDGTMHVTLTLRG